MSTDENRGRMLPAGPKIFTAVPAFGFNVNSNTTASLVALARELTDHGLFGGFSAMSFPDLVDLRNVILSIWYDGMDSSHMLFVDADMQFEPDLVLDMLHADKPLIGALYRRKRQDISWVGSPLDPPAEPEGHLLELEAIGCGAMLIRRDCIDGMIASGQAQVDDDLSGSSLASLLEPHGVKRIIRAFDRVITDDAKRFHLSEDYSFCYRHRKSGGKVYAPINHTVTHLGIQPFVGRYQNMYLERAKTEPDQVMWKTKP